MKSIFLLLTVTVTLIANCLLPTLVSAQTVHLYGMTNQGGASGNGVLFEFNPADTGFTKEFDFGSANGITPYGSLFQASDGNFYGMTYEGGANNDGVLFQYNPVTSTYIKKLDFADSTSGANPRGSLMQASDGNLYGVTEVGGANEGGVLFQYNPSTSNFTDEYDWGSIGPSGPILGQTPYGALTQTSNGNLYGLTSEGGNNGYGVLFQFNPATSAYSKMIDFTFTANGAYPFGSLIKTTDGNLYGMTYQGGVAGEGVIFQYNPVTTAFTKEIDFGVIGGTGTTEGIYPSGSLIEATDGNLYGMTSQGGINDEGVLFQYNPSTSAYSKKVDFADSTSGANPMGSLMQASDGNLYGMTKAGGANGDGVLFQFNLSTSTYKKMLDFTGANGQLPELSSLIEMNITGINEFSATDYISLAPNPASNLLSIHSSAMHHEALTILVMNMLGEIMQQEKLKWSSDINISINNLPAGIYFLQMKTENNSVVKKFIKE